MTVRSHTCNVKICANAVDETRTNVNISVICRNVNCWHFILATGRLLDVDIDHVCVKYDDAFKTAIEEKQREDRKQPAEVEN